MIKGGPVELLQFNRTYVQLALAIAPPLLQYTKLLASFVPTIPTPGLAGSAPRLRE